MRRAVVVLACLLAACGPAPCVVKRADATQMVTAADAALRKAFEAKDGEAAAAFYAENATPSPEGERAHFRNAIRTSLAALRNDPNGKVQFRPAGSAAASEAGDIAYTMGQLDWTATTPDNFPVTRSANYLYIWRIQTDGSWQVVQAISQEIPYESPYRYYENKSASPPPM